MMDNFKWIDYEKNKNVPKYIFLICTKFSSYYLVQTSHKDLRDAQTNNCISEGHIKYWAEIPQPPQEYFIKQEKLKNEKRIKELEDEKRKIEKRILELKY